jgi:hypothetical protein
MFKVPTAMWAGSMVQAVVHLLCKCKTLSSNSSSTQKTKSCNCNYAGSRGRIMLVGARQKAQDPIRKIKLKAKRAGACSGGKALNSDASTAKHQEKCEFFGSTK